jgi:hypothetical protein
MTSADGVPPGGVDDIDGSPATLRVGLVDLGAVGTRAARALIESREVASVMLRSGRSERLDQVVGVLGSRAAIWGPDDEPGPDVVILCGPAGSHVAAARHHVGRGRSVVSCSDDVDEVVGLLALDADAKAQGVVVVAGAAFSPGLSCVLARHAAGALDRVDQVHAAMVGVGGPACSAQRRKVHTRDGREWRDGRWEEIEGGSSQELVWFPDPISARDCGRGALAEPILLQRLFPEATLVTARAGIDRADRMLGFIPKRSPVAPEGEPGAIRVEISGIRADEPASVVYAVMDRPSVGTGTTVAVAAVAAATSGATGAMGLGELVEPVPFLAELARRGIRGATFEPG